MEKVLKKTEESKKNMILTKLNVFLSRYFNYVMAVFLLLIFVLGFLFLIYPKYKAVAHNLKNISETKNAELEALNDQYAKIESLLSFYDKISKSDVDKIHKMIPGPGDTEELFRELEVLILKSGLTLNSISLGSESDAPEKSAKGKKPAADSGVFDNVGKIKAKLVVSGADYESFKKFLAVLENNLRLIDIEKVDVSFSAGTANLDIATYYLKEKKDAPKK